ncbi:hypothetical protein [Hymenobacter pini]|uniref:hypothetical protein n=1 Tax=Hymenobacter pini TaxID=2880879 RepID=UPI001CF2918A|nr:hypothetical protein [Hymenobacter pini]MCA8832227.1 hypothetical protein [Hymenobacter pini]
MSTQKSNQPGAPAHKHITFTPASEVNGSSEASASSENATSDRSSRQNDQQKSWLDQQQWLKNIDVNQLSQQVKDLSTKAKDFSSKAVDQVNSLSPTQKVIGGALLVGGLSWLALRSKSSSPKGETYRGSRDEDTTWNKSSDSVYRGATRSYGEDDYATDL